MTEVTQLSDKELSEAINFHRRQRNLSRGVNESANMRQTQMVRMLEAEEARRLEEAQVKKPTASERSRALPDGEPDRSADMKVNKVAYTLDKEPKKKVSLPKAPWNEEVEQIDEISKQKLNKYIASNAKDREDLSMNKIGWIKGAPTTDQKKNIDKLSKRVSGDELAGRKIYANAYKNTPYAAKVPATEEVALDEAGMPSSVVKSKQKYSQMSDKDFADMHGHKSSEELKSMAYRHGYGKDSNEYVNKAKRGSSMKEEVELDEKNVLGSIVKGTAKLAYKGAKKALVNNKGNFRFSTAGRADAADAQAKKAEKLNRDRERIRLAQERLRKARERSTNEEVELDEAPNANWADSAISHSKNQERVAKQQTKTMKAKNSAAKEFQKSSEIHAKTAKADHDTIRARTGQMEEVNKARAQQPKPVTKPSKPEEFKEESNLRITKVYHKWPKDATYAVHNADRSYHKEFNSMEAAKAHHAEKAGK